MSPNWRPNGPMSLAYAPSTFNLTGYTSRGWQPYHAGHRADAVEGAGENPCSTIVLQRLGLLCVGGAYPPATWQLLCTSYATLITRLGMAKRRFICRCTTVSVPQERRCGDACASHLSVHHRRYCCSQDALSLKPIGSPVRQSYDASSVVPGTVVVSTTETMCYAASAEAERLSNRQLKAYTSEVSGAQRNTQRHLDSTETFTDRKSVV